MKINDIFIVCQKLCQCSNNKSWIPLLEADVVAQLYHVLLLDGYVSLGLIHLDTRVINAGNDKIDIVLGPVTIRSSPKPFVIPTTSIEVKMFPKAMTAQQHRVHFEHVINDDLRKLASVESALKCEIIFDEANYFLGKYEGKNRLNLVSEHCLSTNIRLIHIHPINDSLRAQIY
jgi:hypothetical protein